MDKTKPGSKKPSRENDEIQYLKRPVLEETDTPNPLQGPIRDPNQLFHFMKDLKDSAIATYVGVFLDENYCSIANKVLNHTTAEHFRTGPLFRFHYFFGAKRFILITNHINDDASPTEADRRLIQILQIKAEVLEDVELFDYVIVAGDHYWSMTTQNGTACHCGQQHYLPE